MDELPLPPGPVTNGEYVPAPPDGDDRETLRRIRDTVDEAAARAGIDRRRFLLTASGVAASLTVFNAAACSSAAKHGSRAGGAPGASRPQPGGTFAVPTTAADVAACEHALAGSELIVDVHTHHVVPDGPWRRNAPSTVGLIEHMLPADCRAADPLTCVDRSSYLHDLFLASDTTVAVLSDVPGSGPADQAVPFTDMVVTEQAAAGLTGGGAARVLSQNVIAPNVGDLKARLDEMTAAAHGGHVKAFKVYTAWSPNSRGWSLEDPAIGLPVLQHAHDLGVKVFVAHKGLPLVNFDAAYNGPADVVAVSRRFPDMQFVVFHAAWDPQLREGPFRAGAPRGIDSLLTALDAHQVPVNSNVWVDLGTVWRQLLRDPTQAAHAVGKLLKRVGEDRVLWGTDAVWYGSPQAQIQAFRAFQISDELQSRYGYPALTATRKQKVFGGNAATLFGLDPAAVHCGLRSDPLASGRAAAAELRDEGALRSPWAPNGPTTRREMLRWLASTPWRPT
ncbi:MAG: hypothetical protein JWO37_1431 [Acidimicrobiales bacterium]|nr:hypothetical protein [Acidimicrobiales bacterium]